MTKIILLKSLLIVFVWIPYAFKLLHDYATTRFRTRRFNEEYSTTERLHKIQKELSQLLVDSSSSVSLFEIREILDRYAGLSLACNLIGTKPNNSERELFRVSLHPNIELGMNCLHRQNSLRLKFHQTLAKNDFLQIINKLFFSCSNPENLRSLTSDFVEILNDAETQKLLDGIFNKTLQSADSLFVKDSEPEIWKLTEHKQLSARRATMRL